MQARKPDFVTINNRRVKVQQWRQLPDHVLLTALVHGDASGTDLLAELAASAGEGLTDREKAKRHIPTNP